MKFVSTFLLCSIALFLKAQMLSLDWVAQMGGTSGEFARSLDLDASGNVYTTGYFYGLADFDPGAGTISLTPSGQDDIFISKLGTNGNAIWAIQMGGTSADQGLSISVDSLGNVFTTGYFEGSADFDPGPLTINLVSNGAEDIFISKLDSNGNFIWAKQIGGANTDKAFSIFADPSGDIYLTGSFQGTVDFDPGVPVSNLTSAGGDDIFVMQINPAGALVWAAGMGSTAHDNGNSVAMDAAGNVIATGKFSGTADFDPGIATNYNLGCAGSDDIFVSKLNQAGNFVWAKSIGSTGQDRGLGVEVDAAGKVYATGYFNLTVDFDPDSIATYDLTSSGFDMFVIKLDSNGNFGWAKQIGGSGVDYGFAIELGSYGFVYTTGFFNNTADFDPGTGTFNLNSAGLNDIYVSKLDSNGAFVSAGQVAGGNADIGYSIKTDLNQNIYVCGFFLDSADFDPEPAVSKLFSFGTTDNFVLKWRQCSPTFDTISPAVCDSFVAADGAVLTASGNYIAIVQNATGCDSTITINLTIDTMSSSVTQTGNSLTASPPGAVYQWVDCGNGFAPVAGQTGQSFTPLVSGNYAAIVSLNTCTDTSGCFLLTGIDDNEFSIPIRIYPNPFIDQFIVFLHSRVQNFSVKVMEMSGRIVMESEEKAGDHATFNLSGNPNGVYYILMESNEKTGMGRIVKQ